MSVRCKQKVRGSCQAGGRERETGPLIEELPTGERRTADSFRQKTQSLNQATCGEAPEGLPVLSGEWR